jgi:hypothetical protein
MRLSVAGRDILQISYSCSAAFLSNKKRFPTVRTHEFSNAPIYSRACACPLRHDPMFSVKTCGDAPLRCALRLVMASTVQFVRTTSSYAQWVDALVSFFRFCGWAQLAVVQSSDDAFAVAAALLVRAMPAAALEAARSTTFEAGNFAADELDSIKVARLRVVIVMADSHDVLSVAMAALSRQLTTGWAWLGLDTVDGAETYAPSGVSLGAAKTAMHGWLYFEPHTAAPALFFDQVENETAAHFPGAAGDALVSAFAATSMYESVLLFSRVAVLHPSLLRSGRAMANAMRNFSFDGRTGHVELDDHGSKRESIHVVNYLRHADGEMHRRTVGVWHPLQREYLPLSQAAPVVWPGGTSVKPGSVAAEGSGFQASWVLGGAAAGSLILIGALLIFVKKHQQQLQHVFALIFTEATELVGSTVMEIADMATDAFACYQVLTLDLGLVPLYKTAYLVIMCIATVTGVMSIVYRVRNANSMRAHLKEALALRSPQASPTIRASDPAHHLGRLDSAHHLGREVLLVRLEKFEFELRQNRRQLIIAAVTLGTFVCEGALKLTTALVRCSAVGRCCAVNATLTAATVEPSSACAASVDRLFCGTQLQSSW